MLKDSYALAALGRYKTLQNLSDMTEYQEAHEGFGIHLCNRFFYRRVGKDVFGHNFIVFWMNNPLLLLKVLFWITYRPLLKKWDRKMVLKQKHFPQNYNKKLETQDRTEEIIDMNRHRPLTQPSLTEPKLALMYKTSVLLSKSPPQSFDRKEEKDEQKEEQKEKKEIENATEVATEIEELEYTVPRAEAETYSENRQEQDNTQISDQRKQQDVQGDTSENRTKTLSPQHSAESSIQSQQNKSEKTRSKSPKRKTNQTSNDHKTGQKNDEIPTGKGCFISKG